MQTSVGSAEELTVDVKFCLVFPREALSVPVMRHMLGDSLRALGAEDQGVADLLLAVTEACTNVVRHGGPGRRYEVVASVGRGGCRVEILNTGRVFDPSRLAGSRPRRPAWPTMSPVPRTHRRAGVRPATFGRSLLRAGRGRARSSQAREEAVISDEALAALPESGRGLDIMRACVDDVTLTSRPERGTVVSLQKRMRWRADGPFADLAPDELADAG
jgi:anti-sigma regulatory factor (Ser/Thr protein kinase)